MRIQFGKILRIWGASPYFWERIIQIIFTSSLGLQIISIYIYHLKMPPLNHVPLKITLLLKLKNYLVMMGKRSQRRPESSDEIELMRVIVDPNSKQEEEEDAKFKLQKKLSDSFLESSDEIELLSLSVDPNPEQEKKEKKIPSSSCRKN